MGTKTKIENYIKTWEQRCYNTGIPDEAPNELEANNLVPSYKRICKAIMKNDLNFLSLGFSSTKCHEYHELKRAEISTRKNSCIQLSLF